MDLWSVFCALSSVALTVVAVSWTVLILATAALLFVPCNQGGYQPKPSPKGDIKPPPRCP